MNKSIAFLDMSAGYKGVHNTGFLEALYTYAQVDCVSLFVVTHSAISEEWIEKFQKKRICLIRGFSGNFYQFANQQPSEKEALSYILKLSLEYQYAIQQVLKKTYQDLHLVFHTMSWEHLRALSLALRHISSNRLHLHIFLMYWCGVGDNYQIEDMFLAVQYKIALKKLLEFEQIELYTSNKEYQGAFSCLLDGIKIQLHPFFLGNWSASRDLLFNNRIIRNILLYSGEIKADKGFFELGKLIKMLAGQELLQRSNFIIQLSKDSLNSKQERFLDELEYYAKSHNIRLEIRKGFLSAIDIEELYKKVDLVVLNYSSEVYRHKTSGILWLAVQNGSMCAVAKNSWLQRELDALQLNFFCMDDKEEMQYIEHDNIPSEKVLEYRHAIFTPFWQWLLEL